MSSDHDLRAQRDRGHRALKGATGALLAVAVVGAGAVSLTVVPSTAAGTAATTATTTTVATGTTSGATTTAPTATVAAPVAASHGS